MKNFMRLSTYCLFILFSFAACMPSNQKNVETTKGHSGKKPKYIFFFIGDGFGLTQSNATESYLGALAGKTGIVKLELNKFPVLGFYTTYSTSRMITDSAAGGTALATGEKTANGTIAMDADHKKSFVSIAEMAKAEGKKVGIVTSVSIDHATPASFYAHQPSRNKYYEIAQELGTSDFDYFAGGGMKDAEGKKQKGEVKNAIDHAKEHGYTYVNSRAQFDKLKAGDEKVYAVAERLIGGAAMPYAIDAGKDDISLAEFTRKGIELLDNENGFFMMVEGGKIDWSCHANDAATVIGEVLELDKAVAEALAFYKAHPGETLIIVCGDHETGGMALGFSGTKYESGFALLQNQTISFDAFSKKVKLYVSQKNATLKGAMEMVQTHFGLGDESKGLALTEFETKQLHDAYRLSSKVDAKAAKDEAYYQLYGSYDPLTLTSCHILAQKAGIGWTTYSHTAAPIPIRAMGVGRELFEGYFDNTDVAKRVMQLLTAKK